MKNLSALAVLALLAGCISFNSSETPAPEYVGACSDKEQQCQAVCGSVGVQAYSCSARPGEGINLKCECRKSGS